MKKAIFLDRDGTMITDEHYLNDPAKIRYLPELFPILRDLENLGYLILVVTNQSGLSRGLVDLQQMDAIHRKISEEAFSKGVHIRKFYYAPFLDQSHRDERKPGPGMLRLAERDFGISLKESWMIGDKMSDVEAGLAAGCRSILLDLDPVSDKAQTKDDVGTSSRFYPARSLAEALKIIKQNT